MKNNNSMGNDLTEKVPYKHFLWIMRTTFILLFTCVFCSMAEIGHTQNARVTINQRNSTLGAVFNEIEKQTDYLFIYNNEINIDEKVSVKAKREAVSRVLNTILKDKDIDYSMEGNHIILSVVKESELKEQEKTIEVELQQQKKQITGNVKDTFGEPVPGTTVVVKGTTHGTVTDFDGNYSISNVPSDAILQFSCVGMKTQEVLVDGKNTINVTMEEETIGLEEVVAIGYGVVKKSDLTGSVSSISSKAFEQTPLTSLNSMLQGAMPGIEIIKGSARPGGGNNIVRIRGGNSMMGSNDPLYVVDGIPGGSIPNPNNIESVQVLKDASSTAIYGSRGANGVIIITSKQAKVDKQLSIEIYRGIQEIRKKLNVVNASEYAELANEKAENIGRSPYYDINNLPGNTDWQDELFRVAPITNFNISHTGGNESTKTFLAANYFEQKGIVKKTGYSAGEITANVVNKVTNWLSVNTNINANHSVSETPSGNTRQLLQVSSVAPVFNEEGGYYDVTSLPTSDNIWVNPVGDKDRRETQSVANEFNGNSNLVFQLTNELKFDARLGMRYNNSRSDGYSAVINYDPNNSASISESNSYKYLIENIVSYNKAINSKHKINALVGYTYENNMYVAHSASARDFITDDLLTNDIGSGATIVSIGSSKSESTIMSWLGRVNYGFDEKYLFTASFRADGSSRLGADNKWGIFPSGAFAWRVSEEKFLKDVQFLDNLKLRASYGVTGNQEIGLYQSQARLSSTTAVLGTNEDRTIGFITNTMQNPDLKWEVTTQYDIGFDLGCFDQKVELVFDYYHKMTSNLLATVPLPRSSGYGSILKNFGDMENKGVEIGLNLRIVDTKDWSYSANANFSINRNKVLKVATSTGQFTGGILGSPIDDYANLIIEGYPLSSFHAYLEDGLWDEDQTAGSIQPTAKAGDQKYVDTNNDGSITPDDRVIIGDPYPDFIYGLNSNLRYKNFNLNVLVQGVQGGLLFWGDKYVLGNFARFSNQLHEVYESHWSANNPDVNAKYPRLSNVASNMSERFFEDASYIRVKTISLSYNFPTQKLNWIKNAMVYVSGENLLTFTDYSGYDPEVSYGSSSSLLKGVDIGGYPSAKTWNVGINLSF